MRNPTRTRLVTTGTLALALLSAPTTFARDDAASDDPALTAAMRSHFQAASPPADARGDATASADAMVAYFTNAPPPGDVAVASRRHLDLDVKFAFDSAALDQAGVEQLDVAGKALQSPQLKDRRFMLAGHTDDQGDPGYNLDLSRRRAEAARQYLIDEYGVAPERLEATGFGAEQPRTTEDTPAARRANRRVVLEMVQ